MKVHLTLCTGATLALIAISGCAIGPDYHRPVVAAPAFKESGPWQPAAPADQIPRGEWWKAFGDSVLDGLEARLDASSNTLQAAEAQNEQAQAAVRIATATLFPEIDGTGSAFRDRTAAHGNTAASVQNTFAAGLSASWELDLWGRVRRGYESVRATATASAANLEAVRLSLHATLAQTYFSLRVADTELHVYDHIIVDYERSYTITKNLYAQGVDNRANVASAEAQLKSAQATAVDITLQRDQLEHAIAVLIGEPPATFAIATAVLTIEPPPTPVLIPSEQLQRRPDIAAAERQLAAASAGIGVAKGGYFPAITLSGSAGYQSASFSDLFSVPNEVWSLGASALAPLFDAGKVRAQVAQARAVYEASLATYRQTVLSAFQEVEDNLAAAHLLANEAAVQTQALAAAREATTITENQYKAGTVSYLNVVTAQATQLAAEQTAVQLLGRRLTASVTLLKAAGGDWRAGAATSP